MTIRKILAIQHRQMGDVLMCTPALKLIREALPETQIHFLTEKIGQQVLQHNPNIDEIIIVPRKPTVWETWQIASRLRSEKYDAVIDFFGNPRSAQLTFFSGSGKRCGFRNPSLLWAYNHRHPFLEDYSLEYAAITKARLLSLIGIQPKSIPSIEFPVSEKETKFADKFWKEIGFTKTDKVIAFCPVSRRDYKMWPPEYFAETADKLVKRYGMKIWFVYGPGERELAEAVAKRMKEKYTIDYTPPTLPELRAVMEKCSLYVGNDGGNKHIAVTAGIPTATLFRQLNPENWTPPDDPKHTAIAEGGPGQPPLGSLTPEDMLKAVEKIERYFI